MKNKEMRFKIVLEPSRDKGYAVHVPALRGCHSQGETYEEIVLNITEAIQVYIDSLKACSEPIPSEDVVIKPIHVAA